MKIDKYLTDLNRRIDNEVESELWQQWLNFTEGNFTGDLFIPERQRQIPAEIEWPRVTVNQAQEDYGMMALQQFKSCSQMLIEGSGSIMAVRCNYGTSIIPSLFGVELFMMDEELDTLPTSKPLAGGLEDIKKIVDQGVPDINQRLGQKVFNMAERYLEIMEQYPALGEHVYLYHPDLQGPMDICEVLWGSDLFLDIMDEPQLVHQLLEIITQTYIDFMDKWQELVPFNRNDIEVHWSLMHQGHIMLRDDSAMNFSPEMFDEFIRPYDQKLLDEFGGGAIHFCGRGDHYIASVAEMDGVYAVAMSQPDYNDMETIYQHTVDKDIKLIGFSREAAEVTLDSGRDLQGNVQV